MENTKEYIEPSNGHTKVYISAWRIFFNNLLGGLAWGFGTVLGATIVAGLIVFILSKLNTIPLLGSFISQLLTQIQHGAK